MSVQPNVNFNISTSILVLIGTIAFSYFTHVGWWSIGGLSYLLFDKLSAWQLRLTFLIISIIIFLVAIFQMGWSFL